MKRSEGTSERPKCLRDPQFLTLLTSKCSSRHKAVHFFDISTSKSAPRPPVFNTFYFQMCFAPQRRALISTSQRPKVVRTPSVLCILTSKCASRHNGVHFFDISTSKSGPTMVCFCTFWLRNGKFNYRTDPNPRRIGIRRSTKVRYFTVLLCSWLRSITLALTVDIDIDIDIYIEIDIYIYIYILHTHIFDPWLDRSAAPAAACRINSKGQIAVGPLGFSLQYSS